MTWWLFCKDIGLLHKRWQVGIIFLFVIFCHWIQQKSFGENPNELVYSDHSLENVTISESKKLQKASYEMQEKVPVLTWLTRSDPFKIPQWQR